MASNNLPDLVSMTHRMAQAEILADQLRGHLLSLPVTDVESLHVLNQYDALVATLRAEIADWQKLGMTCATVVHELIRRKQPLTAKEAWNYGGISGVIITRSPTREPFSLAELEGLENTWPHLGHPVPPITTTTKAEQ
jgi:hypothetical protein